ncbi:hypothetical protein AXW37_12355 [Yersinia ruckeri]|uniref:hypothetical protein n=1 Tax=Yersinia ruckeri TaxID=29486 RepID=UPI0004E392CD|nr:hypothetical protein [Yersinia ruckeri]ARZ01780.1 hypothetical protein QMA0440_02458 [Yersinia ruckeri]ARZ01849.1 hypothetical protein QMA0440_02527 [Yersinia ruckeri]KFE38530.1 hypothetical protein nADLYRO1b_2338 [Yersinia ruckeri]MCW6523051.1 hypothetical protein [Yersinia ruckeri]MCW6569785.1 hypothetical protein [Yersinia ruckeri]
MTYSDVVATIAMIVSVVALPATYYFGYKAAARNDKRKEWNAVAEPIIEYLEGHLSSLNRKRCPPDNNLNKLPRKSWDSVLRRSTKTKAANLDRSLADYVSILAEIDKSPAPALYFGQSTDEIEEWVDKYPEAIVNVEKLIVLLSLR